MKKILLMVGCLFMVVGCACSNDKAADAVEKYLNDYKGLNNQVLEDIDELVENEDLTDKGRETYREVLKRQYRDLVYTIENEDYDGDTAEVTVKITVYDLYKAQKDASEYLKNHQDEFLSDGEYDNDLYMEYKDKALNPMSKVFVAAMKEWKKSSKLIPLNSSGKSIDAKSINKISNVQQRMERIMQVSLEREIDLLECRVSFLGTAGTVAPFLGLFGTVWGVMSAFSSIGENHNTSLAVIAPGIAIALATTALGLIVAIPAVVGFNKISNEINSYSLKVENFSSEFATIISRQVDETTK